MGFGRSMAACGWFSRHVLVLAATCVVAMTLRRWRMVNQGHVYRSDRDRVTVSSLRSSWTKPNQRRPCPLESDVLTANPEAEWDVKTKKRMVLLLASCPSNLLDLNGSRRREIVFPCSSTLKTRVELGSSIFGRKIENKYRGSVKAFFFNPFKEPILKDAIKEPVAFMGGVFAGLLRLDLNEDPLREWVSRNVEALGIKEDELADDGSKVEEQIPIQIDIE